MTDPTNEQGIKRLLSPDSTKLTEAEKLDKRLRQNSIEIEDDSERIPSMAEAEQPERDLKSWMATISGQLKLTATKQDLDTINNRIDAQGIEIKQIRDELSQYKKNFDNLQASFDQNEARKFSGEYETTNRNSNLRYVNNMAPRGGSVSNNPRKNLVIEGLKGDDEEELITNLIQMTTSIGAVVYKSDITNIFRMNRRDAENQTPGPVMVSFARISLRDNILKKKINLRYINGMSKVYVNADEPVETRRAKAILRKVTVIARQQGKLVEARHDKVTIGDITFTLDDIHKIPSKFLRDQNGSQEKNKSDLASGESRMELSTTNEPNTDSAEKRDRIATARRRMKLSTTKASGLIMPGEMMRVTPAGLLFSGPTAYPSNLHKVPVIFEDKEFNSNEQAYQHKKAKNHELDELATYIKGLTDTWEIKNEGGNITTSSEWNKLSPDLLWSLFDHKMSQNPDLLERLIETAPMKLIEASSSMKWGGGAPFHSKIYDSGKCPGSNLFGETATKYRDQKIHERKRLNEV